MSDGTLYKMAAFTEEPGGGNPAGVWVGQRLPAEDAMQKIAAEVGFSETAFIAPDFGTKRTVRYFSPEAEVSFCGHATIASGAVLGDESGRTEYRLSSTVGEIPVVVTTVDGTSKVALTSVDTKQRQASDTIVDEALAALGWRADQLDRSIPPTIAFAGAWHLVIAASDRSRLDELHYDFERLKALMIREGLTTLQLVWRENDTVLHARNPFPVGGVVEDPATGAAAAALGGYLRDAGLIETPFAFRIRQGEVMGRPSLLNVSVPVSGGITVSGSAVEIDESAGGETDDRARLTA